MCLCSKIIFFYHFLVVKVVTFIDSNMFLEDQKFRYDQAVDQYLAQTRSLPEVIGIIVSGSYAHGQLGPHSDVDIYVITDPSCTERERGNIWINEVEIEYFQNPPQQIRAYFEREASRPVTAHLLSHGELRYADHPEVEALLAEAKAIIEGKPAAWGYGRKEISRYGIDDLYKDVLDCLEAGDTISGRLIVFQLIEQCVEIYFGMTEQWMVKKKRLMGYLKKEHPEFAGLLDAAIGATGFAVQVEAVGRLVAYVEELLGGKRPKEWVLRGDLDC